MRAGELWLRGLWEKKKKLGEEEVDRQVYSDCHFLDWIPGGEIMLARLRGKWKAKEPLPSLLKNPGGDWSSGRWIRGWATAEQQWPARRGRTAHSNWSRLHCEVEGTSPRRNPKISRTLAEEQLVCNDQTSYPALEIRPHQMPWGWVSTPCIDAIVARQRVGENQPC